MSWFIIQPRLLCRNPFLSSIAAAAELAHPSAVGQPISHTPKRTIGAPYVRAVIASANEARARARGRQDVPNRERVSGLPTEARNWTRAKQPVTLDDDQQRPALAGTMIWRSVYCPRT